MNKKSHVPDQVMTQQIFNPPKSCAFRRTSKKCSIDSITQVELKKKKKEGYVRSHVRCRVSCLPKVKGEGKQKVLIRTF